MAHNGHIAVYAAGAKDPFVVIYLHDNAHTDTLLPILKTFLDSFGEQRGSLEDVESLAAWLIHELIDRTSPRKFSDVAICRFAHPAVDFHYAIKLDDRGGCTLEYRESRSLEIKPSL
jgi:hypothetical protein